MLDPEFPLHGAADSTLLSRRTLIGGTAGLTAGLIGQAAFAAAPPTGAAPARLASMPLEFVYEAIVTLAAPEDAGATPFGKRVRIPITGGTFRGPKLGGTIFPEGMDWQLIRADGFTVIEAAYLMREDDGTLIHIHNKGIAGKGYARTTPVFEVPMGKHQWLNESIFTGTLGPVPERKDPAVRITVYRIV